MQQLSRDAASITESLHGDGGFGQRHALEFTCGASSVLATARGGFIATLRPAQAQRLAGDHAQFGMAMQHADGVHEPSHGLGVGVDIRGGDVAIAPDDGGDLGGIAAGHPLQFIQRKLFGIDTHAALAAAIRDIDGGALPGHPGGQGFHLVEGDIRVVPDAAFSGSAGQVVLHAVAFEHLNSPVVHAHGDGNNQLSLGLFQDGSQSLVQFEVIGRNIELLLGDLKGIEDFLGQYGCTHGSPY